MNRTAQSKRVFDVHTGAKRGKVDLRDRIVTMRLNLTSVWNYIRFHKALSICVMAVMAGSVAGFVYVRLAQADIVYFYPDACLGGWEHPEYAQGEPQVTDQSDQSAFMPENSALLRKNTFGQIFCGDFLGTIPEQKQPRKVTLRLSWTTKTEEASSSVLLLPSSSSDVFLDFPILEPAPIPESEVLILSPTPTELFVGSDISPVLELSPPETIETSPAESVQPLPTPEITEPEPTTPISWLWSLVNFAFAQEETPIPVLIEAPSIEPTPEDPLPSPELSPSPEPSLTTELLPSPGENVEPSMSPELLVTPALDQENASSSSVGPEVLGVSVQDPLWKILYTINGVDWIDLALLDASQIGGFSADIPVNSWDEISNFRVSIQSLSTINEVPNVYLDAMILEVEYTDTAIETPVIEITLEPTIVIEEPFLPEDSEAIKGEDPSEFLLAPSLSLPLLKERKFREELAVSRESFHFCTVKDFIADLSQQNHETIELELGGIRGNTEILKIGNLPVGIDIIFQDNAGYEYYPSKSIGTVILNATNQQGSQRGNFSIPIIYISDGSIAICQINIINL